MYSDFRFWVSSTLALLTLFSSALAHAQAAQAGRYVLKGGAWIFEAVVQDQVLNRAIYPAANYAYQGVVQQNARNAQYPIATYPRVYSNSTPAYQYRLQQPMIYGQQLFPQYQQPTYQVPRRVCNNGYQQWYC